MSWKVLRGGREEGRLIRFLSKRLIPGARWELVDGRAAGRHHSAACCYAKGGISVTMGPGVVLRPWEKGIMMVCVWPERERFGS